MKTYIIHVKGHTKSEEYAQTCLKSCKENFEAELFEGVTPDTLEKYEKIHNITRLQPSRVNNFYKENKKLFNTKKSCFLNHVRLWTKCVDMDVPLAVVEQDSYCVSDWDELNFDELLLMNIKSAYNQPVFNHMWKNKKKPTYQVGLHNYQDMPLVYHMENKFKGYCMMPGTAAYAVTPKGAKRLLQNLSTGWEQSDYYINNFNVRIQYAYPEYFTFKLKNLNMSHGKNI